MLNSIRLATSSDLDQILAIYKIAREFMILNNNPNQWGKDYPSTDLILKQIRSNNLYVVLNDKNQIVSVFAFIIGDDETYKYIEDGDWILNTEYGTIHMIASNNMEHGVFDFVVNYCFSIINHLRIDTHSCNKIMQHLIEKNGFIKCGIIYVHGNSKRIAYEKIK